MNCWHPENKSTGTSRRFYFDSVEEALISASSHFPIKNDLPHLQFFLHSSHRKQLELRLQPGGADFREAVAKEVALVEQRLNQREAELQEKLAESRKQYAALENEFRMALTIEAARFSEVCHLLFKWPVITVIVA